VRPAENVAMLGALLLAALVAASTSPAPDSTGLATIHYHQPPPDFVMPLGKTTKSLSELRGKAVLINFWASWCHPCTDELSLFVRAKQQYGNRLVVVTVSSEPHDVAASYLRLWNIELPVVEDIDNAVSKAYSVPPIPVTILVDAAGNVSYVSVGETSWAELAGALQQTIGSPRGGVLR